MQPRALFLAGLVAAASGCTNTERTEPYQPVANVRELMLTILEPAAEQYWDAVGFIDDQQMGSYDIRPTSDEDWELVRNAAYVVAESGNLLMMEGRAVDNRAWMSMSQSMIEVGRKAIAAAEARDEQGVFDAGAEVYYSCTACHSAYAVEAVRPNVIPPQDR
jgi:hypothetical protein